MRLIFACACLLATTAALPVFKASLETTAFSHSRLYEPHFEKFMKQFEKM